MKKIAISIVIVSNAFISYATDTCKIAYGKKYLLEVKKQMIVSLIFLNDSIYQLRSEKEANNGLLTEIGEQEVKKFFYGHLPKEVH